MTVVHSQRKGWQLFFIYVGCAILLFWALAPIYWVFVSSISTRTELYAKPYKVWFPSQPTFDHYLSLFSTGSGYRGSSFSPTAGLMAAGLRNSLVVSVTTSTLVTLLATGAGYIFARLRFRGKQITFFFLMLMMPLPIWVSLIALNFLMVQFNLIDTQGGLIILFTVFHLPLSIWLMSTFIRDVPSEVEDSALVDGCNRWQLLWNIVIPLARPGIIAVFLVALLTTWNNFLIPLIFTRTSASQPLTVTLSLFIGQYEVAWEDMAAAAVMTMLPPFLMALFFQRYLVRGLTMGAIK